MDFKEFEGKDTEQALAAATQHFELSIDQMEIEVVSAGSSGIFGLVGRKKAIVKARPKGRTTADEVAELVSVVSGGSLASASRREEKPKAATAPTEKKEEPKKEPQPAARQEEKEEARPAQPAPQPAREPEQAKPRAERQEYKPRPREQEAKPAPQENESRQEQESAAGKPPARQPQAEAPRMAREFKGDGSGAIPKAERPSPELMIKAEECLAKMAQALDNTSTVSVGNGEEGIELTIVGEDPGVFIGRRGQTLDALQYLVTRMVSQAAGKSVRVVVDAGGYRARRRESLKEMAGKLADKAAKSGHPISTGPLNAQDRRVVHLSLKEKNGIHTVSRGRGEMKKVVISPRGNGRP